MLHWKATVALPPIPLFNAAQSSTILRRELGTGVHMIVEQIALQARQRTPVGVSGILRASIGTKVTLGAAPVAILGEVFTGAQAPYALYVEAGTRPHWPPRGPIELWAQRVLGNAKLWFVVARAISRRGTRPRWMFRDALAVVQPTIHGILSAAMDRAAVLLMGSK